MMINPEKDSYYMNKRRIVGTDKSEYRMMIKFYKWKEGNDKKS